MKNIKKSNKLENWLEKNRQKINKAMVWMIAFAVVLMWSAVVFILIEFFESKTYKDIFAIGISFLAIIFIIYFSILMLISILKYRKEMLLNDTERREKWKDLSPEYKRFFRIFMNSTYFICILLIISGFYDIFVKKDWIGIMWIFIGVIWIISLIIQQRRIMRGLKW